MLHANLKKKSKALHYFNISAKFYSFTFDRYKIRFDSSMDIKNGNEICLSQRALPTQPQAVTGRHTVIFNTVTNVPTIWEDYLYMSHGSHKEVNAKQKGVHILELCLQFR